MNEKKKIYEPFYGSSYLLIKKKKKQKLFQPDLKYILHQDLEGVDWFNL